MHEDIDLTRETLKRFSRSSKGSAQKEAFIPKIRRFFSVHVFSSVRDGKQSWVPLTTRCVSFVRYPFKRSSPLSILNQIRLCPSALPCLRSTAAAASAGKWLAFPTVWHCIILILILTQGRFHCCVAVRRKRITASPIHVGTLSWVDSSTCAIRDLGHDVYY